MIFNILIFYGFLCFGDGLRLFARNDRSLSLLELNGNDRSVRTIMNVTDVSEDLTVSLAVDVQNNVGYYSIRKTIYAVNFSSGVSADLGTIGFGLEEPPISMAFDWITSKIYLSLPGFGHDNAGRVMLCSSENASICSVLLYQDLDFMYSLNLDPIDGNMYWLNGINREIEKAFMNGKHHDRHPFDDTILSSSNQSPTLSSLSIHLPSKRLFFVKTKEINSEIWSCQLYVRDSCVLEAKTDQIVYLSTSNELLIWTDRHGDLKTCRVEKCAETIQDIKGNVVIESFVVLDPAIQPKRKTTNPCLVDNGGCSHFCVLVQFDPWRTCACPIGVSLLDDEKTCDPNGPNKVLLVAALSGLYKIMLDTPDFTPQPILFKGHEKSTHNFYDVDFDPFERKIYWMDSSVHSIRRSDLDGSNTENVITVPMDSVKHFRIDYVNRNIYWINHKLARIYVTSLTTKTSVAVVLGQILQPQGLALDLANKQLYFTENDNPRSRIEQTGLDGSGRKTLIHLTLNSWPSGLIVSPEENRIYWSESNFCRIKTAFLNGTQLKTVGPDNQKLTQPYGITKLGDTIFCNSLTGRSLLKTVINNITGEITATVMESAIYGPIGMKAISLHTQPLIRSICREENGGCSHICTQGMDGERICLCPLEFELSADGETCIKPEAFALIATKILSDVAQLSISGTSSLRQLGVWNKTVAPTVFDYDQLSHRLYIGGVHQSIGILYSTNLEGTDIHIIMQSALLNGLHSISVDYLSKNVYWTNSITKRVEVCDNSGTFRRTLAWKDINPTHLVVHPIEEKIFFVDHGENTTIRVMPLYGSPNGGDILVGDLGNVHSLTIDYKHGRIFWSDTDDGIDRLMCIKYDGSFPEGVVQTRKVKMNSIFNYDNKIYYVDEERQEFGKYDWKEFITIRKDIGQTSGLVIVHGDVPKQSLQCNYSISKCPELCLSSRIPHKSSCYCTDHYTYDEASKMCKAPENMVLIGAHNEFLAVNIRRYSNRSFTRNSWNQDPVKEFSVPITGTPISIAIDVVTNMIFWIEDEDRQERIHFASSKSPSKEGVSNNQNNCDHFNSIALDDLGRQLYGSCRTAAGVAFIVVYRIQETPSDPLKYIGDVISGEAISQATGHAPMPKDITVFPFHNYLFYVDVSPQLQSPAIIQCQLDGRMCTEWYSKDLWPDTRLHPDPANLRLFYTCPSGVWSRDVGLPSSNVQHHFHEKNASDYLVAPIDENQIFVAEVAIDFTRVQEISTRTIVDVPLSTSAMKRIGPATSWSNVCRHTECSHLCRVIRDSKHKSECTCPLGYVVNAEKPNVCLRNVICFPWQFACEDGRSCVHAAKKCDRVSHCLDGSDESPKICRNTGGLWPCDDGAHSVNRNLLCDGKVDCEDGSDERHCRCKSSAEEFDCSIHIVEDSNECVSRSRLCDGFNDCENGMDEEPKMCAERPRPATSYHYGPEWIYMAFLIAILLIIAAFVACCCFRHYNLCNDNPNGSSRYHLHNGTEASILIPNPTGITQCDVALRTYSLVESVSTVPALPPPHSSHTTYSSRDLISNSEYPINRFYAPPPSAASLSTYGVVKPADVRMTLNTKGKRRFKERSPPPRYDSLDKRKHRVDSLAGLSQHPPQMSSTPKSARANSRMKKTPSKMGSHTGRTLPFHSSSSSADTGVERHRTPSSSSLSSHSSEDGYSAKR